MFRPRTVAIAIVFCSSFVLTVGTPRAFADAAGAKKYLDEAKKEFTDGHPEKAEVSLKLADAELDGVPATDPVAKEVAALRGQMTAAADAEAKVEFEKNLAFNLRMSKETLNRASDNKTYTEALETLANSPEGKKFLTDAQRADYLKQVTTMRKASAVMTLDGDVARLGPALERAEARLPEVVESMKERGTEHPDVSSLYSTIESLKKELGALPADNAKVKPLLDRLAKLTASFDAQIGKAMTVEVVAEMKRSWELYVGDWGGWEQETATPTWEEYSKTSGQAMSRLMQPKTVELVRRANSFLKDVPEQEKVKQVIATPEVKAAIDDVAKQRAKAIDKLVASIKKVLDGAEKATLDKNGSDTVGYFIDNIRLMLDGDPQQEPLQARAKAIVDKFQGAMAAGEKATAELVAKFTAQATAAWPAMAATFPADDASFDPADALKNIDKYKGKTIRFEDADNRLGWDYSPGDYDFAVDRNGVPLVGRFDPSVRAAVDKVYDQTKEGIGRYRLDVIAVVEGLAKVQKRVSGDVTSSTGTRVGTVEGHETMDAPLLRIVAVHAGPFAAAAGVGAVTDASAGVVPIAAAGAASSGGGWGWRFLTLLIGLAAGAAALMKANFAPLVAVPQVGAVRTKLGDDNLGYMGVAFAVLGLVWLLRGMIIYGMLTSLAIIAAGLFVALDMLVAKGIVKPDLAAKVRPFGTVIGLACAALAVLSFVTGGALRII